MSKESERLVEAALFISGKPVSVKEIQAVQDMDPRTIRSSLERLQKMYSSEDRAIEILKIGSKYSMQVKEKFKPRVSKLGTPEIPKEVLKIASLIGYYQPILQSKLAELGGPKTYESVKQLAERGMIRARPKGRSFELTTTRKFVEYFGIDASSRSEVKSWFEKRLRGQAGTIK